MIEHNFGDVFVTFVDTDDEPVAPPQIVDVDHPYSCQKVLIEFVDMERRMFWCKARVVIKGGTEEPHRHLMDGFFCGGSRKTKGRAFVFKPVLPNGQIVYALAEVDNVGILIEKETGEWADDSPSMSSSSSSEEASSESF